MSNLPLKFGNFRIMVKKVKTPRGRFELGPAGWDPEDYTTTPTNILPA